MRITTNNKLKFENTFEDIPEGFVRDYVLIIKGRYENTILNYRQLTSTKGNQIIGIPKVFKLHQNFPNPFNPATTIKFDLPIDGIVSIKVYDILGKEVYSLQEVRQAGFQQLNFNGSNVSSGIYFYKIAAGNFVQTKRMILLK
ncbi:MAG: T9SS type A sorting domain-containing protein [Ignavibacteria bacterium]|nr:T9SS type A sorting domain-containing protein [Ignavibacteria bacterium]